MGERRGKGREEEEREERRGKKRKEEERRGKKRKEEERRGKKRREEKMNHLADNISLPINEDGGDILVGVVRDGFVRNSLQKFNILVLFL